MQADHKIYSVPVGEAREGETRIYRNPRCKDGFLKLPPQIHSFADFWDIIVAKFSENKLCQDLTFSQVLERARKVGSWMMKNGHSLVYLYCKNCIEWTITDVACMNYGVVNVPLYDTLGEEALDYILKITEGTVLYSVKGMCQKITKILQTSKYNLKEIVFFGEDPSEDERKAIQAFGVQVTNFDEIINTNQILERPTLNLETPISYCFTSGTTGLPKGVIQTHQMGISILYSTQKMLCFYPTDVHISFLPIAHTYERVVTWCCMFSGANIKYSKYPVTELVKDLAEIRPTMLPLVPRLINKFYPLLKGIYEKQGNFDKVRQIFGGRVRIVVTGSAPISPEMIKFLKKALGCIMIEGYGQTETTAATFLTAQDQEQFGHVGGPNESTEFKLIDVPEMNYLSTDNPPRGQICTRGTPNFKKYFKNEDATKEAVDEQGWNHSGDIGIILPNGAVKIIDRRKNIFKLSQGQYIAPQKVENIYVRCKFIAEAFVYGESLKTFCVGIIHPNMEALPAIATKLGLQEKDPVNLCQNQAINAFILSEITKQGKEDGLFGFEMAKKIYLTPKPFALVGVVTSTMKLQRHLARKVYEKQIEQLYAAE